MDTGHLQDESSNLQVKAFSKFQFLYVTYLFFNYRCTSWFKEEVNLRYNQGSRSATEFFVTSMEFLGFQILTKSVIKNSCFSCLIPRICTSAWKFKILLLFWLVVEKHAVLSIMSTLVRMDANSHQTKVAGCMKTLHDCKFAGDKVWVQTWDLGRGRERGRERMIRLQSGVSLSPLTYMFAPCALTSCTMFIQVFLTKLPTNEHGLLFVYKELYVMYHVNSGTFDNIPNQQEWAIVSLRSLAWENLVTCSFTDYTHSSNYLCSFTEKPASTHTHLNLLLKDTNLHANKKRTLFPLGGLSIRGSC